jgi:MFS family permease
VIATVRQRLLGPNHLPRTFWFLWAGTIVNRIGGFVIPFLTLYLTTQRGLSVGRAALMVSLFGAGSFAANLVGGELADRLGRRPVLLVSFFVAPVAMLTVGMARGVAPIAAATLVLGFFTDLYRPAVSATIADIVPPEGRPRAYGYIYWAINLGAAIAPVLAGLMARFSYTLLFVGDALTTFGFGLLVLWGVAETRPGHHARAATAALGERLTVIRREPLLLMFTGLALVFGTIYQQGIVTLPIEMRSHGLSPELYGLVIAINGALIVLLGLPASNSASRWPRFGAMAAAGLLLGTGFGVTALATSLPIFALSVAIWTLGEIAGATVAPAVVADLAPVAMRGLYQGVFGAAWGLSFFTGPVLGGWILDQFGPTALWGGCFAAGILLALGYLAMAPAAQRRMRHLRDQEAAASVA